jgi:hypothetical protein
MAARKKAKRKRPASRKSTRGAAAPASTGDLVRRIAEQMAAGVERGLAKTLRKLPVRAATAAAKTKLKDAIAGLRRQAESFRQQAQELEARGAETAASVWRPLADRVDKTAQKLAQRL